MPDARFMPYNRAFLHLGFTACQRTYAGFLTPQPAIAKNHSAPCKGFPNLDIHIIDVALHRACMSKP